MEPKTEEVSGGTYQDLFRNLLKIITLKFCAIINATPDPIAILIEMISEKLVDINKVKNTPIKNPTFTTFLATIFPYARFAKSVIKNVIG